MKKFKLDGLSNISKFRLLGLPEPIQDEVFSSWLIRMIASGKIKKEYLLEKIGWLSHLYLVDIHPELIDIQRLTMEFNLVSANRLQSNFLEFPTNLPTKDKFSLTVDVLNKQPTYRFCCQCLSEDKFPFIRKLWRYAFAYICDQHCCLLRDKCDVCGHGISPDKVKRASNLEESHLFLMQCSYCKSNVSKQKQIYLNDRVVDTLLHAQNMIVEMIARHQSIDDYLMRVQHLSTKNPHELIIGLSGSKLFGSDADEIRTLFNKYQLFGSTFWQPSNIIFLTKTPKQINNARSWVGKQLTPS